VTPVVWLVQLVPAALFAVLAWWAPGANPPTLPFGVRVPPDRAGHPVIESSRRGYRWWVGITGSLALLGGAALAYVWPRPWTALVPMGAVICLTVPAWARARGAILRVKRDEHWYRGLTQAGPAQPAARVPAGRFPWLWALPAVIVIAVSIAAGVWWYPHMPDQLAMHYNAEGVVDRSAAKSVASAFGLVFLQAGITALIVGAVAISFRAKADVDPAAPEESARRHRVVLGAIARGLLVLAACTNVALLLASWATWSGANLRPLAVLVPVLAGLAALLGSVVVSARQVRGPATGEATGVVHHDDDAHWKGGVFYVNRDDPSLFVPKRFGIGWTVNFASPKALLFLLALAAIMVLLIAIVP